LLISLGLSEGVYYGKGNWSIRSISNNL
jgi:hypothetical protein